MHKCPKRCQSHGMFGKSNALNDILCFQRKLKCCHYSKLSNKASYSTLWTHQKTCTQVHHLWSGHIHEKTLQPQITSFGSSHTQVTARKAFQTMSIINHILSHMHGCANWCYETTLTLFIDNWLNAVCHCQCHSHTLTFISITICHAFLWIMCVHSSQITSQVAFTSAPFWRRISTTSLHPSCADACKGVMPSWGVQHGQQMQTHKRGWSANKC